MTDESQRNDLHHRATPCSPTERPHNPSVVGSILTCPTNPRSDVTIAVTADPFIPSHSAFGRVAPQGRVSLRPNDPGDSVVPVEAEGDRGQFDGPAEARPYHRPMGDIRASGKLRPAHSGDSGLAS